MEKELGATEELFPITTRLVYSTFANELTVNVFEPKILLEEMDLVPFIPKKSHIIPLVHIPFLGILIFLMLPRRTNMR